MAKQMVFEADAREAIRRGVNQLDRAVLLEKKWSAPIKAELNADTLEDGDLIRGGVIGPTKVVRSALENAIIAEFPEAPSACAAGARGDDMSFQD